MKDTSQIPTGIYCYSEKGVCPYYWNNPLGFGDCSFWRPRWKFWEWNGWKDLDPALDDQCKACGIKDGWYVIDSKSKIFIHPVVMFENGRPLIEDHRGLTYPENHEIYKTGYEIIDILDYEM